LGTLSIEILELLGAKAEQIHKTGSLKTRPAAEKVQGMVARLADEQFLSLADFARGREVVYFSQR
jgi:hypothetical protein